MSHELAPEGVVLLGGNGGSDSDSPPPLPPEPDPHVDAPELDYTDRAQSSVEPDASVEAPELVPVEKND